MRVRFTVPAQADLENIYTYITQQNPFAAERVKAQIKADAEGLGEFPFAARATTMPEMRAKKVKRYPYLIFYTIRDEEVLILHVRHGARRWPWEEDQ